MISAYFILSCSGSTLPPTGRDFDSLSAALTSSYGSQVAERDYRSGRPVGAGIGTSGNVGAANNAVPVQMTDSVIVRNVSIRLVY